MRANFYGSNKLKYDGCCQETNVEGKQVDAVSWPDSKAVQCVGEKATETQNQNTSKCNDGQATQTRT